MTKEKMFLLTFMRGLLVTYLAMTVYGLIVDYSLNLFIGILAVMTAAIPMLLMSLIRIYLISLIKNRVLRNAVTFFVGAILVISNIFWPVPLTVLILMTYYTDKLEQTK
jgi:hypothetical protein